MELNNKQIQAIASSILISDIKEYINAHLQEYEQIINNGENTN